MKKPPPGPPQKLLIKGYPGTGGTSQRWTLASDRIVIPVIKKSALDKKAYQEGFDEMFGIIVQLKNGSIYGSYDESMVCSSI